jgi:transposase
MVGRSSVASWQEGSRRARAPDRVHARRWTGWALGIEARSRALLTDGESAERLSAEAASCSGAPGSKKWTTRIGRRLARAEQTMRVRIARDELRRLRELTLTINQLAREITELVGQIAPQLLSEPGFGPLIAAKLVGEIAGAQRFATPAKLARAAGVAPIPASSGNTRCQRLDQGGNRQINAALHRVIVTRARCHQPTRDYITLRDVTQARRRRLSSVPAPAQPRVAAMHVDREPKALPADDPLGGAQTSEWLHCGTANGSVGWTA